VSVASNTGPLIALAKVDLLPLLATLFGDVQIPTAVHRELLAKAGPEARRLDDALASTIQVVSLPPLASDLVNATQSLGAGEREAIALAQRLGTLLLIDDRQGRNAARTLGLRLTGTAGVLIRAKQVGLLPSVRPMLLQIRGEGYWFSDALIEEAAKVAGEA